VFLLHRAGDRVESHVEIRADEPDRCDDHDSDERSNETILDGSGAAFISKERETSTWMTPDSVLIGR